MMQTILTVLIGVAAVAVLIWLCVPSSSAGQEGGGELIDPDDSRQIGMLVGLAGGGIADAAVARFALKRFEETHGRKATTRDVGVVVGLMTSLDH